MGIVSSKRHSRPAAARDGYPARIVCLTEETTETLYRIGAGDLVVGVSAYTQRPSEAKSKPRVSAFIQANYDKIMGLRPDLVLAFSDLQAEITRELIRRGVPVFTFNQRSIEEILTAIRLIGGTVGYHEEAARLARDLAAGLDRARERSARLPRRPRVYFEEWDDPLISGIRWVSELIGIAGGEEIFPEFLDQPIATGRMPNPDDVIARDPEVILASWCGKKADLPRIAARPGWDRIAAVRAGRLHEIDSILILQPGPAALTDGLAAIERHVAAAAGA
ncbi:MAG: cobalamin-binding protein [Planctomycetes bacterium]|nr:cobalamin-binding protein [Planctomycetota bacterium]